MLLKLKKIKRKIELQIRGFSFLGQENSKEENEFKSHNRLELEMKKILCEIKKLPPSKLVKEFMSVICHSQNTLLLNELAKRIRKLSKSQTDHLHKKTLDIIQKHD